MDVPRLDEKGLPPLHGATSAASMGGQRRFLRATQAQLALLVVAAVAGAMSWRTDDDGTDIGAVVALFAFTLAGLLSIYLLAARPDRVWYEGRAAAESVKTLAWRYAVAGEPFRAADDEKDADALFIQRIRELLQDLKEIALPGARGAQITDEMRALRAAPLSARKHAFETDRIENQERWYSDKAEINASRATSWTWAILGAEAVGLAGAIARVTGLTDFNVLGIAAAVAAAFTAWLRSKQHEALSAAYSIAAQELASIRALIGHPDSEESWAAFVEDAEEAISREHTLWRASRGLRRTPWFK